MTTKWIGEDGRPHDHTSFCRGNGCTPVPATPAPSQPMSAVRMDEMGVDDVAIDATMFRFERMDEQTFWLCAYREDKRTTFTMWTQGGKLYCRRDDDELGTTDDSENPVTPELTPAPSQPAGAREWTLPEINGLALSAVVHSPFYNAVEKQLAQALIDATQHTAAKDAEAETFRCQLRDALKLHTGVTWFGAGLLTAASAVVAERDSLREANARLAADLDAALKVWKDGQK